MLKKLALVALAAAFAVVSLGGQGGGGSSDYTPKRINKAIELLERDQPIYYTQVNGGGYEAGKALADRKSVV